MQCTIQIHHQYNDSIILDFPLPFLKLFLKNMSMLKITSFFSKKSESLLFLIRESFDSYAIVIKSQCVFACMCGS